MKRRDVVVGGLAVSVGTPAWGQVPNAWENKFIDQWIKGSWRVEYGDKRSGTDLFEIYSHSPSSAAPGAFDLRGGTGSFGRTPGAAKSATARPTSSGAQVSVGNSGGSGRYDIAWRASDTQEGTVTWFKDSAVSPVKLRRLSASELALQRDKALEGEKPLFVNASYFG